MKKIKRILNATLLALGTFLINPAVAWAQKSENITQPPINLKPTDLTNITDKLTPASFVSGAIRLVLVLAALLFFFMLVIGGIQWIVSGGDKAGSENARKRITNALIGLAIVFAAWAIVTLINALFGINIFTLEIPPLYQKP